MIKVFNQVAVELVTGNIIEQLGYTAVVNAANAELMPRRQYVMLNIYYFSSRHLRII